MELYRVNTLATLGLLDACARTGARRFVHASSGTVYGLGSRPFRENDPVRTTSSTPRPRSTPRTSSRATPTCSTAPSRCASSRPTGPARSTAWCPGIIGRVRDGRTVTLVRRRPPAHEPDLRRRRDGRHPAALEADGHLIVNVAGDEVVTIREIAEAAGRAVGREPVFEQARRRRGGRRRRRHHALPRVARRPPRSCRSPRAWRAPPPAPSRRCSGCAASRPSSTAAAAGSSSRSCCAMTDAMRHRGPDDEGWYAAHGVGLGNRRLAIIDLTSGGHQPMSNEDGSVWITYNGDALQLPRAAARSRSAAGTTSARPATPRSSSTPTRNGVDDCLRRFDGMFAFADLGRAQPSASWRLAIASASSRSTGRAR